jgi:hypothetical protein
VAASAELESQRLEKSLSEGTLKPRLCGSVLEELANKRWQISRSIQNLEQQSRVLDYFLDNQVALKTREGNALAKRTIDEGAARCGLLMHRRPRRLSDDSNDEFNSSSSSASSSDSPVERVKRNLFSDARNIEDSRCVHVKRISVIGSYPQSLKDSSRVLNLGFNLVRERKITPLPSSPTSHRRNSDAPALFPVMSFAGASPSSPA